MIRLRGALATAVLGVLLLWAGVLGAGALAEGYSAGEDTISSLAGRGSSVAALGVIALLAGAVAHLAGSVSVRVSGRSRWCSGFLLCAAAAAGVVAAFRVSCPGGAAGCSTAVRQPGDWVDTVHAAGVVAYEAFVVAAMLTVAAGALDRASGWPRWLGALSLAAAATSVGLLLQTGGEYGGAWQRAWLAGNHLWLLTLVTVVGWRGEAPG